MAEDGTYRLLVNCPKGGVQLCESEWLLVSNYVSEEAATAAIPMVQEIIKPMVEQFGMKLEPIAQGEVTRSF